MGIPVQRADLTSGPVVLTVEQIEELNQKLSKTRHDINNHLAVMVAALELIRFKPESAAKWLASIESHPMLIGAALKTFSEQFEKALGITPGSADAGPPCVTPGTEMPAPMGGLGVDPASPG